MGMLSEYSERERRVLARAMGRVIDDVGPEEPMTPELAAKITDARERIKRFLPPEGGEKNMQSVTIGQRYTKPSFPVPTVAIVRSVSPAQGVLLGNPTGGRRVWWPWPAFWQQWRRES